MSSSSIAVDASARVGLQRVFWRVHFWAGVVTAPIVLFAACTGLLYVFTPQIEARVHADVDWVLAAGATRPLDAQWAATKSAAPDAIRTNGIEAALHAIDVLFKGRDLTSSLTYADSTITKNDKFPVSVGQWQPRVPKWRANLLASYAPGDAWSGTIGLRYSGKQFGTLDNSDPNDFTDTGVSSFLVAAVRAQYRFGKQWKLSAGIDNLNNKKHWAFHPYPQRTFNAELRFDH